MLTLPGLPKKVVHMATTGFTNRIRKVFGCFTIAFKDQHITPPLRPFTVLLFLLFLLLFGGGRARTYNLQIMSLTRYPFSLPRAEPLFLMTRLVERLAGLFLITSRMSSAGFEPTAASL